MRISILKTKEPREILKRIRFAHLCGYETGLSIPVSKDGLVFKTYYFKGNHPILDFCSLYIGKNVPIIKFSIREALSNPELAWRPKTFMEYHKEVMADYRKNRPNSSTPRHGVISIMYDNYLSELNQVRI